MKVSVLIIIYEPIIEKLIATIESVIQQEHIAYEIIVSDDGSKHVNIEEVKSLISGLVPNNIPFRFIKNSVNSGTVLNIYNACKYAKGDYLKIISPGDLLFDNNVLRDIYAYALNNPQNSFFFGKPVYYNNCDELKILETTKPQYPELYNARKQYVPILALMYGQGPVGAAYFYKTDVFLSYLSLIVNHVKYTEDYTTSILYLLDGGNLSYIDRKIVWYEFGSGISTSNAQKWEKIYKTDCDELYKVAKKIHVHNRYLEFRFGNRKSKLFHPIIIMRIMLIKALSKHKSETISSTDEQIAYLINILNESKREVDHENTVCNISPDGERTE